MGRFLNADIYAATGQGFVGNNMFAYCNNNPINTVDYGGNEPTTIVLTVGCVLLTACLIFTIVSPQFQRDVAVIARDFNRRIFLGIEELEKVITRKMEISLAKAATKKSDSTHIHHIVAQTDPRAVQSRWILEYLFVFGVNDSRNLVVVDSRTHQRLHTNAYYMLVEHIVVDAFWSAKPYKEDQIKHVEQALNWLRGFIGTLSGA